MIIHCAGKKAGGKQGEHRAKRREAAHHTGKIYAWKSTLLCNEEGGCIIKNLTWGHIISTKIGRRGAKLRLHRHLSVSISSFLSAWVCNPYISLTRFSYACLYTYIQLCFSASISAEKEILLLGNLNSSIILTLIKGTGNQYRPAP